MGKLYSIRWLSVCLFGLKLFSASRCEKDLLQNNVEMPYLEEIIKFIYLIRAEHGSITFKKTLSLIKSHIIECGFLLRLHLTFYYYNGKKILASWQKVECLLTDLSLREMQKKFLVS